MAYHLEIGGMPLHDVVGVNVEKNAATDNKGQVPSIWAKGCMLMIVRS